MVNKKYRLWQNKFDKFLIENTDTERLRRLSQDFGDEKADSLISKQKERTNQTQVYLDNWLKGNTEKYSLNLRSPNFFVVQIENKSKKEPSDSIIFKVEFARARGDKKWRGYCQTWINAVESDGTTIESSIKGWQKGDFFRGKFDQFENLLKDFEQYYQKTMTEY